MGSDFYETPEIDQLAAEGMVFTNAYSAAANCAPARACLLTGQYTPRHKIYNVGTHPRGQAEHRRLEHIPGVDLLPEHIPTWAHQIQSAGYRTAIMGKWHLSDNPLHHGFDLNVAGDKRGGPPGGYTAPFRGSSDFKDAPNGSCLTDLLTQRAITFIQDNQSAPWLLFLSHFAVHTPLESRKDLLEKYKSKQHGKLHSNPIMAGMIEAVDQGVGRLLDSLASLDLDHKTIVILYSDNGGYGPATDMAPLKGYKGTYYEGGIRVPLIIKWPGVLTPGSQSHEPVTGVDLYPTLCEMADAPVPHNHILDGLSLVPLLKALPSSFPQRPIFWHFPAYLESYSVRDEQRDPLFRSRPCSAIRFGNYKLIHYFEDNSLELYNLDNDISESTNLALKHPGKLAELYDLLTQWHDSTNADIPGKWNPAFNPIMERDAIRKSLNKMHQQ